MQFTRLRLSGFKSFVDPTEMRIEPGLTGIVGPNGCGKSNLVEALRWVMGEGSAKSLRGAAMDDVIFAGTTSRPARNAAEVALLLDNQDRRAPAAFNHWEALEVSRRIVRESGSVYRVNGREARARDVQLLFADSATGAQSPALVRQGQISALINAKPVERRAILEEAAGIAGLHSRRREAELKLRAAESNLTRLADLMGEIEARLAALKRQARQAVRYRTLSADLRSAEAILLALRWKEAAAAVEAAVQALAEAEARVEETTRAAARAVAEQADAASVLPDLRAAESDEAAALHRLTLDRDRIAAEQRHARERLQRDRAALDRMVQDAAREQTLLDDARQALVRAEEEQAHLRAEQAGEHAAREEADARAGVAAASVLEREQALDALNARLAALSGRRQALARERNQAAERLHKLEGQIRAATAEHDALAAAIPPAAPDWEPVEAAVERLEAARAAIHTAEQARAEAQGRENAARDTLREAETDGARLHAEAKAIASLIGVAPNEGLWPPMIDAVSVPQGLETALAAALGEGLNAPADEAAPIHWTTLPPYEDALPLPDGAKPLAELIGAPPALARPLSQVGLVTRNEGPRSRSMLQPGQCLVSREGDLWRWDGFTVAAEAPTQAARGLEQRNRLKALEPLCREANTRIAEARDFLERVRAGLAASDEAESQARKAVREAEADLKRAQDAQAQAERAEAQHQNRLAAATERLERLRTEQGEAQGRLGAADAALAEIEPEERLREDLAALRREVDALRVVAAQARGVSETLRREADARTRRLQSLERETDDWTRRVENASDHIAGLAARRAEIEAEIAVLADVPERLEQERETLTEALGEAEARRKQAADRLAAAETRLADAERTARAAEQALGQARETRAARQVAAEAAGERAREAGALLTERTGWNPDEALSRTGLAEASALPSAEEVQGRIERLRRDRDALGAVNLRAEEEMREAGAQLAEMEAERRDLDQAIARLRQAIGSLNREGRGRLLASFETVDAHFARLFGILFGGGEARLGLVESDDPLEAGLEITARPPGKKPQVLSLLSGGEQALTALALIFAVFLTNPAPICVLDEVDAPLDDANVDRFCRLIQDMAHQAQTRFLVITHHALTMARMDRLYGVTMAERGVSQLVSVDLGGAEALRAVG